MASRSWKEYTFLEKVGAGLIVTPLLLLVMIPLWIFMVLYDGFIFQQIWNLTLPKLFPLPALSLIQAIAISLVISYHQIRKMKHKDESLNWAAILITPLIMWAMAWILSTYFI